MCCDVTIMGPGISCVVCRATISVQYLLLSGIIVAIMVHQFVRNLTISVQPTIIVMGHWQDYSKPYGQYCIMRKGRCFFCLGFWQLMDWLCLSAYTNRSKISKTDSLLVATAERWLEKGLLWHVWNNSWRRNESKLMSWRNRWVQNRVSTGTETVFLACLSHKHSSGIALLS